MFEPFYFDTLKYRQGLVKESLPDNLYHYTKSNSTFKILPSATNENISFFATERQYLNDSAEYVRGLNLAKDCLLQHKHADLDFINDVHNSIEEAEGQVCVVSFTESGDNLNQYRIYSENGGYCLQFDPNQLNGPAHLANRFLAKCIYSKETFMRKANDSISWHMGYYQQTIIGKQEDEKLHVYNHCCSGLAGSLRLLASIFKHDSFKEEREWRYVFQFPNNEELQCRKRDEQNIPYTEVSFPLNAFSKVYISPGSKQENANKDMLKRLRDLDLKNKIKIVFCESSYNWS